MRIVRSGHYLISLRQIIEYIARDKYMAAVHFLDDIDRRIESLGSTPYRFRQSRYYDDIHVRDMIFKGYTIPYLIDESNDTIVILDIFKWIDR